MSKKYTPPVLVGAALLAVQHPQHIRIVFPKDPDFDAPLALNWKKGSTSRQWRCVEISLPKRAWTLRKEKDEDHDQDPPPKKTCYAYGHGPLRSCSWGGKDRGPWPRLPQKRLDPRMVMVIGKWFINVSGQLQGYLIDSCRESGQIKCPR